MFRLLVLIVEIKSVPVTKKIRSGQCGYKSSSQHCMCHPFVKVELMTLQDVWGFLN